MDVLICLADQSRHRLGKPIVGIARPHLHRLGKPIVGIAYAIPSLMGRAHESRWGR